MDTAPAQLAETGRGYFSACVPCPPLYPHQDSRVIGPRSNRHFSRDGIPRHDSKTSRLDRPEDFMQMPPFGGGRVPPNRVGVVRWSVRCFLSSCIVIAAGSCSPLFAFADSTPEKNVLFLCSFSLPEWCVDLENMKTTVRSRVSMPVNFYVEYLESQRFSRAGYEKAVSETLRQAYSGKQIDLVVTSAYPALRFAIDHRDQIFPGVPIVFEDVRLRDGARWPGVTGVKSDADVRGSVGLALSLNPDTRNVAVIVGNSEYGRFWLGVTRSELQQRPEKLGLIEILDESPKRLLEQVSKFPPHTIVFFNLVPQQSTQEEIGTYDLLAAVAQRLPTYCILDYCLNHGAVGGSFVDEKLLGVLGGAIAARVLSGEKPENIPISQSFEAHPTVDWRQLRRWNMSESALPAGTKSYTGNQRSGSGTGNIRPGYCGHSRSRLVGHWIALATRAKAKGRGRRS